MHSITRRGLSRRAVTGAVALGAACIPFAWAALSYAQEKDDGEKARQALAKMTPSEQLLHSTVQIICDRQAGDRSYGTGFFFALFPNAGRDAPVIVTNKHVVDGSKTGHIRLTSRKDDGTADLANFIDVDVPDFPAQWIPHPDPDVDLTVLPLAGLLNKLLGEGKKPFMVQLDPSLIPTDAELVDLTALEEILVVGYPDGISDPAHNIPVFRRGITATPVNIDFADRKEFLIDAAIFPGSSGSPVLLYNQGSWQSRGGLVLGTRIKLLGVVHAVMLNGVNGEISIVPAPTQARAIVNSQMPNNLGVCLKASRILEFEPLFVQKGFKPPDGYVMRAGSSSPSGAVPLPPK